MKEKSITKRRSPIMSVEAVQLLGGEPNGSTFTKAEKNVIGAKSSTGHLSSKRKGANRVKRL